MKLLKWTFALTYCEYGGKHFTLDCGPIGLSVVGEVAIIYMEDFQMRAQSERFPELKEWPWYVDDSVLKCKGNRGDEILEHLNEQEPGIIKFTMEKEEENRLAALDLQMNVNRKRKKVEFNVHYKKTNTNITLKKQSNHQSSTKKGVIKGYSDRARTLCDPQYLQSELQNIEDVFVENGYTRKEIQNAMKETQPQPTIEEEEEPKVRGIVSIPNIPTFTRTFSRLASQHNFRVATKAENKVRDVTSKARTPLGDKNTHVTYNIPCGCEKHSYSGETDRMWGTRKKEHEAKVRLTMVDIENGNIERATERMNTGDGGLAKHMAACEHSVNWEAAKIVGRERNTTKRKYLEGIVSLKEKSKGIIPLNSYNQMEPWQPVVYAFQKNT